ncbi:glycosyltransferase family 39 protein [bacterium]|nr:glycosyltransferase family 39 protein [bacterium]
MDKKWTGAVILASLITAHVALHLATAGNYGIFRDEFYYIDCARHLDWGYVDHPPLSIAVLAGSLKLLGDSAIAVRFMPALIGGLMLAAVWVLAGIMDGGLWAKFTAAFSMFWCAQLTGSTGYYSMNAFDYLFWAVCFIILALILKTGNKRMWLLFGIAAGLGLQNKISVFFLLAGMGAGLLLTRQRIHLKSGWFWAGAGIAGLIFLPHILWQTAHGWPTLEFMSNAQKFKMEAMAPLQFFLSSILSNNPATILVWVPGLVYLLVSKEASPFRPLAWIFIVVLVLMAGLKGKPYYFAPAYTAVFAAGGLALERALKKPWAWLRSAIAVIIAAAGLAIWPFCLRILSPESFIAFQNRIGIKPEEGERHEMGPLPQFWADHFGWEELAETVAEVYSGLTPEQKADCAVFGRNYGEAGAVNYYRKKFDLPPAISEHNNYYLWGPGSFKGGTLIVIGVPAEELTQEYETVEQRAVADHPYAMPYERNLPICVCFRLREPVEKTWGPPDYI